MQQLNSNILIISNMGPKASSPYQGKFVQQQADALRHLNAEYHFMSWHSDSILNRLLKYPFFLLTFIWKFIFSRKRFDIVHVHFFYPTIWLALLYRACRNRQVRIVVTCHGSDIYKYQPPGFLYRWSASFVDFWIFTSKKLQQSFFLQTKESMVLSAGIAEQYGNVHKINSEQKDIDILYVGALDENKGMDRLIALLPLWADYHIVLAGSGPWAGKLQQLTTTYPKLKLAGAVDTIQLASLYQRSKCFISLSRNESFGLVMAEAMACYTPVIATQTDGSEEQIVVGENGWLVSQQQSEQHIVEQVNQSVRALLSLPAEQYLRLQLQGRQSAGQYLLSSVVAQLQHVYQRVIDNGK